MASSNDSIVLNRKRNIVYALCKRLSIDPKVFLDDRASDIKSLCVSILKSSQSASAPENNDELLNWISFAENYPVDSEACFRILNGLNGDLIQKSVIVGGGIEPSEADVIVFSAVHSSVIGISESDREKVPHVMRWMDYIQGKEEIGELFEQILLKKVSFEPPVLNAVAKVEAATNTKKTLQGAKYASSSEVGPNTKKSADVKKVAGDNGVAVEKKETAAEKKKVPEKVADEKDKEVSVSLLKIQVGLIRKAWKHPSADSLLVEEIDVGEAKLRQVVSGLAKHCSPDQLTVNSTGAKVLEYISDFGKPSAPLPAAIVACVPKKVHVEGIGESEFKIVPTEIISAIKEGLQEPIEAEPELEVPKELITSAQLEELRLQQRPSFIPVSPIVDPTKVYDKETGITQRRLSNGIPVNYKITTNEARGGVMRLIVGGGRAAETFETRGAVVLGVRTLSEGGRVGNFSREQVELFCVNHLINCSLESTEEFICMEFRFTLRDNGMRAAFQLLHMVLEHSVWLDEAFDRARQLYLSYYRSIPKSLERSTAHKLMLAMLNGDERFVEPTPHSLQNLTLQCVKDAVMNQFVSDNMEVSIVGDFSEEDIESCILDYIGTVGATKGFERAHGYNPIIFQQSPSSLHFQQVFLKDTDERACAYIAGPAPNRWGFTVEGKDLLESMRDVSADDDEQSKSVEPFVEVKNAEKDLQRRLHSHPLFFAITMGLLAEIINSRLFTTVRDSLGLTYDVSFELNLFDRLNLGWYVISVTSTPGKVHKAVDACKNVLRGLHSSKVVQRELDRAKRTLLMRHEAETKSNAYWLGLLAHLQATSVPRKDISCIKDLTMLYEAATIGDIYLAYEQLKIDDNSLYSCIGIAGAQAGEEILDHLEEGESVEDFHGVIPLGRGSSTMTRPTT